MRKPPHLPVSGVAIMARAAAEENALVRLQEMWIEMAPQKVFYCSRLQNGKDWSVERWPASHIPLVRLDGQVPQVARYERLITRDELRLCYPGAGGSGARAAIYPSRTHDRDITVPYTFEPGTWDTLKLWPEPKPGTDSL